MRSGCLYRISVLKALIKRKNLEIFQSAIFYVKMPITCCVYQCHNRQGKPNTRFFSFSKDEGDGLLPSEEINGSPASILKSAVPISSSGL